MASTSGARRPRVAMVVDNDVTHDSRVIRTAATAAAAGCEVLVVGQSRSSERWSTRRGRLQIVRVPLLESASPAARALARVAVRPQPLASTRIEPVRRRAEDGTLLPVLRGRVTERLPAPLYPGWRHIFPQFVALRRAAAPLLRAFAPDLLHAHDLAALVAGASERTWAGPTPKLVYDAHEYVRGLDTFTPSRRRACIEAETEHLGAADRVITVSEVTAERLEADYDLRYRPDVIFNAPLMTPGGNRRRQGVRAMLDLPDDVPLLVYAGQVKPARGLGAVVDALPALPDARLALVTSPTGADLDALLARADRLGVAGRVHVLPYVAAHDVSAFLADADLGISALVDYGNAQATLPTKLFEYLHAGLPVVVSDVRASRELVTSLGFGEPFRPQDAADFARAVRLVLGRPSRYRPRADVLARHSWERQGERLLDVYAALLGSGAALESASPDHVAALAASTSEA